MAVQARLDNTTIPFIKSGISYAKETETLIQDAGRAVPLVKNTLMAQISASKKWEPFTDETAVDGTAIAKGIYLGDDIPAADLVAGDVVDSPILIGGCCTVDKDMLTIENSKTLDTVVGGAILEKHRVEDDLNEVGIFVEKTVDIDVLET